MTGYPSPLVSRIEKRGSVPFEEFMDMALYDPDCGYYTSDEPTGPGPDFQTAPEISPAFGHCLARFSAAACRAMGLRDVDLVELGAGRGTLAQDFGQVLATEIGVGTIHLVDRNVGRLPTGFPDLSAPVIRRDRLPEGNDVRFSGVILCNELFDALPVRRCRRIAGSILESRVTVDNGHLREEWHPSTTTGDEDYARRYLPASPEEYTFEYPPMVPGLMQRIRQVLKKGIWLIVDYGERAAGLWTPARNDGTLRAFKLRRVKADLLHQPGQQDLTSDVNFDYLMDQARTAGFSVRLFQPQGKFLIEHGLLEEFTTADSASGFRRNLALKTLILPGGMGEIFKILVLE